jgi:hypothetical protein
MKIIIKDNFLLKPTTVYNSCKKISYLKQMNLGLV